MSQVIEIFRHEQKFYIARDHARHLMSLLDAVMLRDAHAKSSGYLITSIYFDDFEDNCLLEKLDGVRHREKYRVRYYERDTEKLKFEIKKKRDDYVSKSSHLVHGSAVIQGDVLNIAALRQVIRERQVFSNPLFFDLFSPVVIVEYRRSAYYLPYDNIRVTIDSDIRSFGYQSRIVREGYGKQMIPGDLVVLEVKYRDRLPPYLRNLISSLPARRSAISKYVLCRQTSQITRSHDEIAVPR